MNEEEILAFGNAAEWRSWLEKNGKSTDGVKLVFFKKKSGKAGITYFEALEEALCFGWIDGKLNSIDEERYMIRFTPRRKKSIWSEVNKKKVLALIKNGKMTEAGMAAIAEAKKNGQWKKAYNMLKEAKMPEDLKAALKKTEMLKRFCELTRYQQNQFIYHVEDAKTEVTRSRRIQKIVCYMQEGKKPGF